MWSIRVAVLAAALIIWQVVVETGLVDELLASRPTAVVSYLGEVVRLPAFWHDFQSTSTAALVSLVVGSIAGIVVGLVLHEVPVLSRAVSPYIALLNGLPRPALAPLFLVWFGLGLTAKVAVAVTIVFFVLLVNVASGLRAVDADQLHLARSLGMTRRQRLLFVELQSATPSIIAGLRLAAVYAVLGVVVSEMVAATDGLGLRLVLETNSFNIAGTFGILLVLALLATLLDAGVSVLEQWIARRRYGASGVDR